MTSASDSATGLGAVLRSVVGLSAGTTIARGLAVVSQFLLAVWLTPFEFGLWAAANSVMAFLAGLTNFGEVNGYLSGRGSTFAVARFVTRRLNLLLTLGGGLIVIFYAMSGRWEVGLLAAVAAITIPIQGEADLLYAAAVKHGFYKNAVLAQLGGAVARLTIGVGVAALTASAMAFATSSFALSLVTAVLLYLVVRRSTRAESQNNDIPLPARLRMKWAVNSWMMTLPLQVGFVVAQFVATPTLLGLYYFSYQITTSVSGLVAGPLSKVSLFTLGSRPQQIRSHLAIGLANIFGAGTMVVVSVLALASPIASTFVSADWQPAIPATIILLASLPVRMMSPVMDALQQSNDRWWQSTAFNAADVVGTAVCALTLVLADITILAVALAAWKVALGIVRTWVSLRDSPVGLRVTLSVPLLLGTVLLVVGAVSASQFAWIASLGALVTAVSWVAAVALKSRGR